MKLFQGVLLSLAILVPAVMLMGEVRAEKGGEGARVQFVKTLAEAKASAAGASKPMVLAFQTGWCGYCKKMDRTTWRDPKVIARAERDLVFARFNAEDGAEGERLARRFAIGGYPTLVVLDASERELGRVSGYRDADTLLAALDRLLATPTRG